MFLLTHSWHVVYADLVVDGDADHGGVAEPAHDVALLAAGQELKTGHERRVSLGNALQALEMKYCCLNARRILS